MVELLKNERIDDLQIKGLKIIQNKDLYCFTADAVLLANFCKIKKNDIVVDLCSGSGVISILIAGKSNAKKVYGIELQKVMADMSKRSLDLNNLNDKVEILNIDLKDSVKSLGNESVNVVVCNPPYNKVESATQNLSENESISRHEVKTNLQEIINASSSLLKYGGKFFMVHQSTRLVEIFSTCQKYNLEPKVVRLIQSKSYTEPYLTLIECVKGGKSGVKFLSNLIMNNEDGTYTDEVREIYRKEKI
jgi:tRNA1Val (adenine37-N6)-methyltransferase